LFGFPCPTPNDKKNKKAKALRTVENSYFWHFALFLVDNFIFCGTPVKMDGRVYNKSGEKLTKEMR